MIDPARESVFPLTEVPARLPAKSGGKRPHVATVRRWVYDGFRGVRLETLKIGTGRYTSAEARSLTPESFNLDGDPTAIMVATAYSKRRRDDVQPIPPELANALRPWVALKKARGKPVFGNLTRHTADLIRADLEAAKIPHGYTRTKKGTKPQQRDVGEKLVDFHSLRHSYVTALATSSAPVKVVQSLARHSTPTLTLGVYTHVGLSDQTSVLGALLGSPSRPSSRRTHKRSLYPSLALRGSSRIQTCQRNHPSENP